MMRMNSDLCCALCATWYVYGVWFDGYVACVVWVNVRIVYDVFGFRCESIGMRAIYDVYECACVWHTVCMNPELYKPGGSCMMMCIT